MRRPGGIGITLLIMPLILISAPLVQADREAFDDAVNFSLSLPRLHSGINRSPERIMGQTVLIDGIVSSITHYGTDETDFLVLVELVSADWEGLEEINLYRAYVLFGPDFMDEFPPRPGRDPGPRVVPANSHVLVAGQVTQAVGEEGGSTTAVIEAYHLRRLQ